MNAVNFNAPTVQTYSDTKKEKDLKILKMEDKSVKALT